MKQVRREQHRLTRLPMGGARVIKIDLEALRKLIEDAGATLLFLPPYSPDPNPIEMVFSKIKQLLRSIACRTREALWNAMQSVLDKVTRSDAINCFTHCGYTLHLD